MYAPEIPVHKAVRLQTPRSWKFQEHGSSIEESHREQNHPKKEPLRATSGIAIQGELPSHLDHITSYNFPQVLNMKLQNIRFIPLHFSIALVPFFSISLLLSLGMGLFILFIYVSIVQLSFSFIFTGAHS